MNKIGVILVSLIVSVYGNGEISILHHPASLHFKGHEHLKESILNEVYSAALGFSTEQYSNWEGLYINDPFNLAEAVVTVAVDGVAHIGPTKGHHFPLRTDVDESAVFESLQKRITERYPEGNSHLVRVELAGGLTNVEEYAIFNGIQKDNKPVQYNYLKASVDEDRQFLSEIELLNSISAKIEEGVAIKADSTPDLFWFKVDGLHAVSDLYGENATQVVEAKQALNDALARLNSAFAKAYKGAVLVSVISSDASHTRRSRRSILQAADKAAADDTDEFSNINLASKYTKDYPVIFNIILWFGVAMFFSLLAICLAIGNMDPGRDSIIYRMTSTRMKKDN